MPVVIEDRPTEAVREEVIDQLIMNYSHGNLSYEAFESRLDKAMESKDNKEIAALADDLDIEIDKDYVKTKKRDFGINYSGKTAVENDSIVNIFGGSSRTGRWAVAKEIKSISIFGGSNIDFTDAEFSSQNVTVKVFCFCGGNNIYIPEHVNVVTKAFCIFGGIDNDASSIADRNAPTITIEGLVIMGGIDIEIKRTIKEKFVEFADNLKRMFQ